MTTNATPQEAAAITEASRELEQALQELEAQIREYEQFGKALTEEMQNYRNTRRRWLV